MDNETILSAGIDIGTTTTHLVISRLGISISKGFGVVPSAQITSKEILYKSPVYFTPLLENGDIDGAGVAEIIEKEYNAAGIARADLKSGAVIITGESAAKGNARSVIDSISALAGDFIAAQAGSELESLLAGRGAGADILSKESGARVAAVDIGGGTTNISVFEDGECESTACLNIGGRLVREENGRLCVSPVIKKFTAQNNIEITDLKSSVTELNRLCEWLAKRIFTVLGFYGGGIEEYLITDHPLGKKRPETVLFSGGVAECMGKTAEDFAYGDIGVLLARAVEKEIKTLGIRTAEPLGGAIRATVIGAGQFSLEISGSTIRYSDITLPLKNLPCVQRLSDIGSAPCAICLNGKKAPSFSELCETAEKIVAASRELIKKKIPIVVILKEDCSMALGNCIKRLLPNGCAFLCADGISCKSGDYIDIGKPVAGGMAVPVIVKTLVFGGKHEA